WEDLALLRHPADAFTRTVVGWHAGDVATAAGDRAVIDPRETLDGEQQRRLADAIAAKHGEAAVLQQGKRNVVEHNGIAVAGGDVVEREERLSHGDASRDKLRARARPRKSPAAAPRRTPRRPP